MRLDYAINPRKIGLILGIIALYFVAQSLIEEYLIENVLDKEANRTLILAIDLFSVNAEETIPTWFSSLILFTAAVLLAFIAAAKRASQDRYTRHWVGLAVVFLYLSMDEAAVIHEILADALQTSLNATGYLTFAWQLVALPLVVIFALLYLRFFFHLPPRTRNLFLLAGGLYAGGALIGDAVSANAWYLGGGVTFGYLAIATLEELCEMLGVIVFIYALLSYIVQMQYSFAFQPQPVTQEASQSALNDRVLVGGPHRISRSLAQLRPAILVFLFIVAMNAALVYWALTQAPSSVSSAQNSAVSTQAIIDQAVTDDVLVARMIGRFGGDNLTSRQVAASLLALFDEVMVVTSASMESSLVLAADKLPFDRDNLADILTVNGETQFIIFDTPAVKAIVGNVQIATQDG